MADKSEPEDWVSEQLVEAEYLRQQMLVSMDDYRKAVTRLVSIAMGDTSGSEVTAQVLLSIYNGRNWHLSIPDLGRLDSHNLYSALVAIRGWIFLREYPHNVIDNGKYIFDQLEVRWENLHVYRRYSSYYQNRK